MYCPSLPEAPTMHTLISPSLERSFRLDAWAVRRCNVEAEHHPALVMFGDMAVRHPHSGVGDVEEDVDGFAGSKKDGVLPDQVRFDHTVACEHDEAASPVDVERMVHGVI